MLTAIAWKAAVNGDWGDPSKWDLGRVPTGTDDVTIAFPGITVTSTEAGNAAQSLNSQAALTVSSGSLAIGSAPVVANTVTVSGGELDTQGAWSLSHLVWTGGTLGGGATISVAPGGTLSIQGTADKSLAGPTLVNHGTATWVGSGGILLSGGSVLDNAANATLSLVSDATLSASGTPAPALHNEGYLAKLAGSGTSTLNVAVTNTGTLDVETGTLAIVGSGASLTNLSGTQLTGGAYVVRGVLEVQGAAVLTNAATIALVGPASRFIDDTNTNALVNLAANAQGASLILKEGRTLAVPGGFSNRGTLFLAPGDSLFVSGSFTQAASGALDLLIGGAPATGLFGQLQAAGPAALGGTLNIGLTNGYAPTTGQAYPVVSYSSAAGNFAAIHGLALPGGGSFITTLSQTDFILTASVHRVFGDYDGDGKTDLAVFRPPDSTWYVRQSTAGGKSLQFGVPGDIPVPADYDGDGKTDIALFRPSTSQWLIMRSSAGPETITFGGAGDIPVAADYDGDGKADLAVFRPSTATWYIMQSTAGPRAVQFGAPNLLDFPVPADYDGDGRADLAVFRFSTATWYINQSSLVPRVQAFGVPGGSLPVPADYDGDGRVDLAVLQPSSDTWYLSQSTAGARIQQFGGAGDVPVPGDYDGDGKTDLAVYRPGNATWYILQSRSGPLVLPFGAPALDVPLPTPFVYRFNGSPGKAASGRAASALVGQGGGGTGGLSHSQAGAASAAADSLVVIPPQPTAASGTISQAASPRGRGRALALVDAALGELG